MLRVWYSNHIERLVDGLVEAVAHERKRSHQSVFARTPVVVPNWNLETYLKFGIARRTGIAAHVEYLSVVDFFESLLPADSGYRLLSDQMLELLVIEALADDKLLGEDVMQPVRGYLAAAGSEPDAIELRRFQLGAHVAQLFSEYGFNRPQMLSLWSEAPQIREPGFARIERWQRRLWLHLFGNGGRLEQLAEQSRAQYVALPRLFEHIDAEQLELPASVHLFGMTRLGRAFENLLGHLGEHSEVFVWALNPCREFWEDVVTDPDEEAQLLSSKAIEGGQLMLAPNEEFWEPEKFPPPLRRWGRAGRDHVRMLNRICNHDPRTLFVDPIEPGETTLRRLQRDVLTMEPEREEPIDALDDDSITFLAHAGPQREVEAVASEIWALMRDQRELFSDESLRFNDIAVIVNPEQRAEYQTHIQSVFRDVHDIPFNIVDLEAGAQSRLVEALQLLLELPFGQFRRRELLRLLAHPNVVANFPEVEPEAWLRWCDELGIIHGADHGDHDDTYIEEDLFNWDQGLKRMVLGGFMTGEPSGDTRAFRHGRFSYLPHEYAHGETGSAARLVMTARSLIEDARRCRREKMSLRQWCGFIGQLIDAYIAPTDDDEEYELMRCRRMLADFAEADVSGRDMAYRVPFELLRRAFDQLELRRGQYLADGVVVSSFMPMRPMPFRVIILVGMGEASFPSSEGADPLDLRLAKWQEGDARGRDRDKYMFLQTLLSARDRLYLSYVSRDSRTGEELEPSSVVRELQHILERGYLGPEKTAACVRTHPLRRFDEAYFGEDAELGTTYHPEARREAAARKMRESLLEHCRAHDVPFPSLDMLEHAADERTRERLAGLLGTYRAPAAVGPDEEVREVSISFSQLRQFLESPLQASARWVLGLRSDEEEDLLEVEDELFESSYVSSLLLARDVFSQTLTERAPADAPAFLAAYEEQARHLELKGELPTGPFREGEREKHLALLGEWLDNLDALGVPGEHPLQVKRFGRADRHAPVDEIWDSITFDLELADREGQPERVRVELFGETNLLDAELGSSTTLVSRDRVKDRDFLRGFIDCVALAAAGKLDPEQPFDIVVDPGKSLANARKLAKYRKRLAPLSQPDALAYLEALAVDFLSGVHAYVMPIEAVFDYHEPDNEKSFADLVAARLESRWSSCSSQYGPVREPERFRAPDDAAEVIERRFAPFFARLLEGGDS